MIKNSLISIFIILMLSSLIYIKYNPPKTCNSTQPIYFSLVGPMTGNGHIIGKSILKGANLYIDKVNASGGINGKCVKLDIYDDQNKRNMAIEKASEIVSLNRSIGVIGHWYSSCSFAAGMIYKKNQIPVITPGSTNVKVTRFNPWYFRMVFNDHLQGRFLANYAIHILSKKNLIIVYEDNDYGNYLATVFEATGQKYNTNILFSKSVVKDENLRKSFSNIIESIKNSKEEDKQNSVLFIAGHASFSTRLIYRIRKAGIELPIIVPDSCASDAFWKGFHTYPKERRFPGYYSNGIYVTTHMLFDIANEKSMKFCDDYHKRYEEPPDWIAAHAYDATMMFVKAAEKQNVSGKDIKADRKKIQKVFYNTDRIETAIEGVTGMNCFDRNGDSLKPVSVGYYHNQRIIPAHVQFQAMPSFSSRKETEKIKNSTITIDGQKFYKTCVVYTGISIKEISDLKPREGTCRLSFDIWFRYHGNIHLSDITFANAAEPITLGDPVETDSNDYLQYKRFAVQGIFKTNFLSGHTVHRCQVVGFQLYHPTLKRNQLVFVPDKIGMSLTKHTSFIEQLGEKKLIEKLHEWTLNKTWIFQSILKKESLGKLEYINQTSHMAEYSLFNMGIRIQKSEMSFRGMITEKNAERWIFICGILTLLSIILKNQFNQNLTESFFISAMYLLLSLFISIVFLLSIESFLMNRFIESLNNFYLHSMSKFFDVLWWVIPTFYIHSFISILVWQPIEKSTKQKIPNIVRRFVSFIIYTLAFLGIVAFVFDQKITSLLATSGVIAMIIGLAIQINISNIFSGIAINIERPFGIGDWVKVGTYKEGQILDITWRTTRLKTRDDSILSIPNSVASESVIHNFHFPNDCFRLWFNVFIDSTHAPEKIKNILFAAVSSSSIVEKQPEPLARFMGLTDWAAQYMVAFTVKDYDKKGAYLERVWIRVLSHLHQAGIQPATRKFSSIEPNSVEGIE